MADPGYPGIITPYKLTEWDAAVADIRRHLNGNATRTEAVATDLRYLLPKARGAGRGGAFNADARMAAWKLSRKLLHAAACETAAAAAWTSADHIMHGLFAPGRKGGRTFRGDQ